MNTFHKLVNMSPYDFEHLREQALQKAGYIGSHFWEGHKNIAVKKDKNIYKAIAEIANPQVAADIVRLEHQTKSPILTKHLAKLL